MAKGRKKGSGPDRWFITEKGVRLLAEMAERDPDADVRVWKAERAEQRKSGEARLRVVTGETMLKPDDVENLRYTTEEGTG